MISHCCAGLELNLVVQPLSITTLGHMTNKMYEVEMTAWQFHDTISPYRSVYQIRTFYCNTFNIFGIKFSQFDENKILAYFNLVVMMFHGSR